MISFNEKFSSILGVVSGYGLIGNGSNDIHVIKVDVVDMPVVYTE